MTSANAIPSRLARFLLIGTCVWFGGPRVTTHAAAADFNTIVVTNDLVLEKGATLKIRLIVRASHVTIDGNGAVFQGPGSLDDLKSLEQAGVGISIEGCTDVTLRNCRARGFATGLRAKDCQGLLVED